MITVTIEGKAGEGKTRIGLVIKNWCDANGWRVINREDITDAALERQQPDVLIVTKAVR